MTINDSYDSGTISDARQLLNVLDYEYCRRVLVALVETEQQDEQVLTSRALWDEDTADLYEKGRCYNHLLKLDAAGFVAWHRETDSIRRGPRFDELLSLLHQVYPQQVQPSADSDADSSLDNLFDALSHPFRRQILTVLARPDSLHSECTDFVHPLDEENETDDDEPEPDILERELRQRHLALLDEYGFVDWNPQTETLTRGGRFDEIHPILEFLATYRAEQLDERSD